MRIDVIVRYLVDSAPHLGRFFLLEKSVAGGESQILLEGPDGQVFRPADLLPVLSRTGHPVALRGSDLVLCWLVRPGRGHEELRMGLRYLAQWPEGPQPKLSCW